MKMIIDRKKHPFRSAQLLLLSLLFSIPAWVQGQNWKTAGNNTMSTDFLGTINLQDLRIRTNGTQKAVMTTTGNLGIGTASPAARLDVIGQIKITDGTHGIGKVLTSDANGLASWQMPFVAPIGWGLTGNSGTVDGTNFLGTTDNIPLNFRVNNEKSGRIDPLLFNTFFGYHSGSSITSGNFNTASGGQALYSNTTGFYNTASGGNVLYSNSTGHDNTAAGFLALYNNGSGNYNIANGGSALYSNTDGSYNTAGGLSALVNNTSGSQNTAIGLGALSVNTIGNNNTALGYGADVGSGALTNATAVGYNTIVNLSNSLVLGNGVNVGIGTSSPGYKLDVRGGNINTDSAYYLKGFRILSVNGGGLFSGIYSGSSNTTGINNTAFGNFTLQNNTSGNDNTAIGTQALISNTGNNNTATGTNALFSNTTGNDNTANGWSTLRENSTGYYNSAAGSYALYANTAGFSNTASGVLALRFNTTGSNNTACGSSSLLSNNAGNYNTGVGVLTLNFNVAGSFNTALGYNAGMDNVGAISNFTALGYGAGHVSSSNNSVEIGNTSVAWIGGQVGWSTYSDKRIKDNIQNNVPGLSFITKLNPVTYNLNIHRENEISGINSDNEWDGKYDIEKVVQTGFLAQEVEQAAKAVNYDFNGVQAPAGNSKLYSIQYASFVVPLVKAVQELAKQNEELKNESVEQQKQIDALKGNSNFGVNTESPGVNQKTQAVELTGMNNAFLGQNAPNPFSTETTIEYYIPESQFCNNGNCSIVFYDQLGRIIQNTTIPESGFGTLNVSTKNLSAGVFTYKLLVNGEVIDSRKMVFGK